MYDYDLVVIGSGPGGQKAAIAAAKLGKRVAVIERRHMVGGVCVNTGTIPSKTLREAVLYLSGLNQREMYGQSYRLKHDITMEDLRARTQHVIAREIDVVESQFARNHVRLISGSARFVDPHTLGVGQDDERDERHVTADMIVIATGTRPARPASVQFDERTVIDSDGILALDHVPASMVVVGAGIIGIEYASMFAALGTRVAVVERRDRMLDMCDAEIVEALQYHLRELSVTFRYGESVAAVEAHEGGAIAVLASGKKIAADTVVYSAGRQGVSEGLDLGNAGLTADDRGRLKVGADFRTTVDNIFAVGDLIGFPALAATAMEQGRLAAYAAFDEPSDSLAALMPIGIYTVPEISFVGATEHELTEAGVPYEVGIARYRELARGQIVGDSHGMLKLLVSTDDRRILGVHVFGTSATELVHIGQAYMTTSGTVDHLIDGVFNYPTLSEAYKVAALDAGNKMRAVARLTD
jgi:NAD(P) transhydrogenase